MKNIEEKLLLGGRSESKTMFLRIFIWLSVHLYVCAKFIWMRVSQLRCGLFHLTFNKVLFHFNQFKKFTPMLY